jgi:two-component system LytT family response regulator
MRTLSIRPPQPASGADVSIQERVEKRARRCGMALTALIVDDEPLAREWIRSGLAAEADIEIVGECGDGFQAVQKIGELAPRLIFLDVQMPGLDGLGVLEMVGDDEGRAIVFVTAFDQYALKAFEAHAVDYLMKPFSHDRLREAVRRARSRIGRPASEEVGESLKALVEDLRRERAYPEWFLLKKDGRSYFLKIGDIDWVESSRNNVRLHVGSDVHVMQETTAGIEARLDPKRFMRIHRSTIVQIDRIREMHPWFNGDYTVTLRDGTQLTMSQTYREKLKQFRRYAL